MDVAEFPRVGGQVVELADPEGAVDQLVGHGADHRRAADALRHVLLQLPLRVVDVRRGARELIPGGGALEGVRLVRVVTPLGEDRAIGIASRPAELRRQAAGEVGVPGRDLGQVEDGRGQVEELDRLADDLAARPARHPRDERHARDRVVERARPLLDQTPIPRPVAVVGEEEDGGVVRQPALVQRAEQFPQQIVDHAGHAEVDGIDLPQRRLVELVQAAGPPDQPVEVGLVRQLGGA